MATLKDNSANTAGASKFGGLSGIAHRTASQFTVPVGTTWTLTSVSLKLSEDTGTPTGNILIGIYTDNSGVPSTTQVGGNATVTAAEISGATFQDFTKSLSASATLNPSTTYWITFDVSTGYDDSNYYSTRAITNAAAGNGAIHNGSSWSTATNDLYYVLTGTAVQNLTLTAVLGTFSLTGIASTLTSQHLLTASVGSYIFTGITATLNANLLTRFTNSTKHSSSFSNASKHSISVFTNAAKHSSSMTNLSKHSTVSATNATKHTSTWTNSDKT